MFFPREYQSHNNGHSIKPLQIDPENKQWLSFGERHYKKQEEFIAKFRYFISSGSYSLLSDLKYSQ